MMKVSAVFCARNMIGSWILRWAERIPFSHTAVMIEYDNGKIEVFESVFPKSRRVDIKDWDYEIVEKYDFEISDYGKVYQMRFFLQGQTGKWYSTFQILLMGVGLLSAPFNKWISSKRWNGSRAFVCTELTGDFFKKFYGASWNESTDTISLTETRDEIKRVWSLYADIPDSGA